MTMDAKSPTNTSQPNPATAKNYTPWPSVIYPRDARLDEHLKINACNISYQ